LQLHKAAGGIINENQERAGGMIWSKPPMLRSIDLHQFAEMLPSRPALVKRPSLLPCQP
jgi:hypothetical protein